MLSFCYKQQQKPPALKASTVDIACTRPRTASSERISCILFAVELIVYQKMLEPHGEVEVLISLHSTENNNKTLLLLKNKWPPPAVKASTVFIMILYSP